MSIDHLNSKIGLENFEPSFVRDAISGLPRKDAFNCACTCRTIHHIWIQTEITQAMDLKEHVKRLRGNIETNGFPYSESNDGLLHAAWVEVRTVADSIPDGWRLLNALERNPSSPEVQQTSPKLFNAYQLYDGLNRELKTLAEFDNAKSLTDLMTSGGSPKIIGGRLFKFSKHLKKYRQSMQEIKIVLSLEQNKAQDKVIALQTYEAKDREMALQKLELQEGLKARGFLCTLQWPQFKELNGAQQKCADIIKGLGLIEKSLSRLDAAIQKIGVYMVAPWLGQKGSALKA